MGFLKDLHSALGEIEADTLTPDLVCELIAKQWGGEQVYIKKRVTTVKIDNLTTTQDLIKRGVPRSTAYRLTRKNWVGRW